MHFKQHLAFAAKCFVAGTVVCTLQGDIFIENIQEGDYVLSTDPDTGDTTYKMVLETYQNEVTQLVHVYTEVEEIITTLTHPFYEADEGWTNASDLEKGDDLCLSDGSIAKVSDVTVEYLDTPVTVYNFAVEDYHTYYVGESDVLVHNACGIGKISSSIKNDPRLVKAAEEMGKNQRIQQEANHLISEFINGNTNPGLGSKNLFKDINYLRGRNGARIFYRITNAGVDILAKANKANEQSVINILKNIYK